MKDLSIEEKAARYDDAIEKFAAILNLNTVKESGTIFADDVRKILPELKESEDERVRREIIEFIKVSKPEWKNYSDYSSWVAWLEKQGGQKPIDTPKFKVGDWVIDKQGIVHQIANVIENVTYHTYSYDIVGGGYFNDNTEGVRLWTLKDAKEGDFIVTKNHNIFIFKEIKGTTIYHYCGLYFDKFLVTPNTVNGKLDTELPKDYVPATKEQCDRLFQKMKEAGYDWDSEKKELKKIEQKSIEPDDLIEESYQQQADDLIDMVTENPAWGEKDIEKQSSQHTKNKKVINHICDILVANSVNGYIGGYYTADLVCMLKSLEPLSVWNSDLNTK